MDRIEERQVLAETDNWYEEWFERDEYDLVYRHRDDKEAEKVVQLIEQIAKPTKGSAVLDVACGKGRHSLALARHGYRVTGIDLSSRFITQAREAAHTENQRILFYKQDMREPVCNGCFDGVVNLFTSFGYFELHQDNLRTLQAISDAMKPGAWFVQDFLNVPYVLANLVPMDVRDFDGIRISQQRSIRDHRVYKEITIKRGELAVEFHESVRLYRVDDFRTMYAAAGLNLISIYGDYEGGPWSEASPRLILLSRREPDGV